MTHAESTILISNPFFNTVTKELHAHYAKLQQACDSKKEALLKIVINLVALLPAASFGLIGHDAAKFITSDSAFGDYITTSTAITNGLENRCVLDEIFLKNRNSLPTNANEQSCQSYITSAIAMLIALSVGTTNGLLAYYNTENKAVTTTVLAILGSAVSSAGSFFGAKKILNAASYFYENWMKLRSNDEDSKNLYIIRSALSKAINKKIDNETVIDHVLNSINSAQEENQNFLALLFLPNTESESSQTTQSSLAMTIDVLLIVTMLTTVSGYVVQTEIDLRKIDQINQTIAEILACITAISTAIGLTGFSCYAALGLRNTISELYKGITNGNLPSILSTIFAVFGMSLSGSSGFLANYDTWKTFNETAGKIIGYIGFGGCGTVNTVYGTQTLLKLFDEIKMCCIDEESKLQAQKRSHLKSVIKNVGGYIEKISDDELKNMIQSGQISEAVLQKAGVAENVYRNFLPIDEQPNRNYGAEIAIQSNK